MKLPTEHVTKSFELAITRVSKFEKHVREVVNTCFFNYSVTINYQFLKYAADALVGIIRFKGARHAARKAFGNDWERIVRMAVYCDAISSLNIIENVLDNKYFFEDIPKILGTNHVMLAGSYRWMSIFCSSRVGVNIPNTGIITAYTYVLRKPAAIRAGIAQLVGDVTYQEWKTRGFNIPENYDRLNKLKQILPDLGVYRADFNTGMMERPCLGDLLITETQNKYLLLDSDGVSPLTLAYNLVFRTELTNLTLASIDLDRHIYITWTGQADLFVRASQIEIWFDIPYNVVTGGSQPISTSFPSDVSNVGTSDLEPEYPSVEELPGTSGQEQTPSINVNPEFNVDTSTTTTQGDVYNASIDTDGQLNISDVSTGQNVPIISTSTASNGMTAVIKSGLGVLKAIAIPVAIFTGSKVIANAIDKPREVNSQGVSGEVRLGPAKLQASYSKSQNKPMSVSKNNNSTKPKNNKFVKGKDRGKQ